ncbi:hypothetical protein [Nostoc sp. DedQUE09]|uniref:hypothetical protein n=1 Tax=Nostoc sp. DedQUE09 TaxID=3075394 RepID=UPI002AD4F52B|nr:hypothetical protein [Nostoc sp. DedQUE09]MDZ7951016.1 hypothetical protein [Nostoc sp. DedQUE09]
MTLLKQESEAILTEKAVFLSVKPTLREAVLNCRCYIVGSVKRARLPLPKYGKTIEPCNNNDLKIWLPVMNL